MARVAWICKIERNVPRRKSERFAQKDVDCPKCGHDDHANRGDDEFASRILVRSSLASREGDAGGRYGFSFIN